MNVEGMVADMLATIDASVRQGDIAKSLEYVADDIVHLPPGGPALVGKHALSRWQKDFYGTFSVDMAHNPDETHDCGELVVHRGTVTGTMTHKETRESSPLNNKYLFVFRKEPDGSLKLWRAMFNSNVPPQAV